MVGENFEIFMSAMPTNVVNCQKSDGEKSPLGRNLKIQIPPQNPFFTDTLNRQNPLENPDFYPKFWGEMTL